MTIEQLLRDPRRRELAADPGPDALREERTLLEAYLVGVRFDAVLQRAWLLFDCRLALFIERGNTAIVVVSGLRSLRWENEHRQWDRTQWTVLSWSPTVAADGWRVEAGTVPDAELQIWGERAEFYVGDVPGCDAAPPDFGTSSDAEIRAGLADWSSEFRLVHASFVDP